MGMLIQKSSELIFPGVHKAQRCFNTRLATWIILVAVEFTFHTTAL